MRGIPGSGVFLFILVILLIEVFAYLGLMQLVSGKKLKRRVTILYWIATAVFLSIWLMAFFNPDKIRQTTNYQFFYFVISISVLNIFPKSLIALFVILSAPFRFLRDKIMSKVILLSGLILSLGMLLSIGYGIVIGRQTLRIEKVELALPSFPKALDELTIVQLSDIHLGSFENDAFLKKCVDEINRINPDLVLFTGDIVNNYYQEMLGFEDQLKALKSKYGKFAILGNHDYGDYSNWKSKEEKGENQQMIHEKLTDAGFQLLLNQSKQISKNDTSLYVVGVENWGHKPFPQYAQLDSALLNVPQNSFKLLMSHDPAHWEDQVIDQTSIPLTLSGHTHGGQFSLNLFGFEFSPIYLIQKYWGGLYQHNDQYMYVNRGIGCVGFLGRIDMAPEITILTLRSK